MRLEQLEYLLAIDRYKSMSRAAEHIHVSHQAISVAIRQLEDELQTSLFQRTSRGSELTNMGKKVADFANDTIDNWEKIVAECVALKNETSLLQTIVFNVFENSRIDVNVGRIIMLLQRHFPNAKIRMEYTYSKQNILDDLENKSDVLAILMIQEGAKIPKNIYQSVISENYLGMLVNKNHPLATRKHCSIHDLTNERIFVSSEEQNGPVTEIISKYNIDKNNEISYNYTTEIIGQYIDEKLGLGLFLFPQEYIDKPPGSQTTRQIFEENIRTYTTCLTNSKKIDEIIRKFLLKIPY